MKRHNARIIAIQTLYNIDINQGTIEDADDCFAQIQQVELEDEYPVEIDFDFAKELVLGTLYHQTEIDNIIIKSLVHWTLDRLSYVDRSLIRLATYEMMNTMIPKQIVINEAIEITKDYSSLDDNEQTKFNNRLLETIAGNIYG